MWTLETKEKSVSLLKNGKFVGVVEFIQRSNNVNCVKVHLLDEHKILCLTKFDWRANPFANKFQKDLQSRTDFIDKWNELKGKVPIQLRGGKNRLQGRIELFHSGRWGTVCDDKFDQNDARVVCRMLGVEVLHPIIATTTTYGEGTGPIWLDDLECTGEEEDLSMCTFPGWSNNDCTHKEDVNINCDVTELRLVNGTFAGDGRIEVKHDGRWGTVCDDSFSMKDAKVVCNMLGFHHTTPKVYTSGHFGHGKGDIFIDDLSCNGNESDINQCTFQGWGKSDCSHGEDVGISCSTPIRLVGGLIPSQGRVEVYHSGSWGSVCDDSFDTKDALVVCRTLGFLDSHPVVHPSGYFGESTSSIVMDDLNCNGTENDISACKFSGWGTNDCSHGEDVGVECQTKVRLVGGSTSSRGRVEIMYRGQWGTICDDYFGQEEAMVVCRMLGYHNSNYRVHQSAFYKQGTGKIWMDDLSCDGSERDITDCKFDGWGQNNCGHSEDVGIDCDSRISVTGCGKAGCGTVKIYHEGQWGTICDDSFGSDDARVVCGMIGHHTLTPTVHAQAAYGPGNGPIWMDDMTCTGKETDLATCAFPGWGVHNCGHGEDVGVDCGTALRLVNGHTEFEGRVEVFHGGLWGTLCDRHFDESEARVVCNIMGIKRRHPIVYRGAHFGPGSGVVWLENMNCAGSETNFGSCVGYYYTYYRDSYSSGWWTGKHTNYRRRSSSHSEWGHHSCHHSQDVSISCKTQIRLVNGKTATEGRVEVFYNGQWGTVCDDSFGASDAKVVCRMLGYDTTYAEAFGGSVYGPGTGSVVMDDMGCSGSEIDIGDCSFSGWGTSNCGHGEDVGVSCGAKIRLIGGVNEAQGRVEIHHSGNWGTVCDDSFDINEAKVICRMLGYDDTHTKVFPRAHFGKGTGTVLMDDLSCIGTETDLSYCSFLGWGTSNCKHEEDVGVSCRMPIRLINGKKQSEGRVEVRYGEQWNTICSDGFDANDARVVCRSLGYDGIIPQITTIFGQGLSSNRITNLACDGTEKTISDCPYSSWNNQNCSQNRDVGVICTTDVRLSNGNTKYEGRLEIKHGTTYGAVCMANFDQVDANVVCSMLGVNNPYPEVCDDCFGSISGAHLEDVNCTGNELDISVCPSGGWTSNSCIAGKDVGLYCKTKVRLYGGNNPSEGRLQVYHRQVWKDVCSDGFDKADAKVICTMLGYNTTNPHIYTSNFTAGTGGAWLSNLECSGTEDDIMACSFPGWGNGGCLHNKYINIACGMGVRLVGGSKPYEGRVEVYHSGEWGTICHDRFTVNDAKVICRMLGYETGNVTIIPSGNFGTTNSRIMMDELHCSGKETHIASCSFSGWGIHNCDHNKDTVISCGRTPVRLVNGSKASEGRLEVFHNNMWGTVCSKHFDINDARVVCKNMGYNAKYPFVLPNGYFGVGNGFILLDNVNCVGTEDDIANCQSGDWGHSDCSHQQDVSMICDTMVRLANGENPNTGRVELFHNGEWGTVCDDSFDVPDAAVICTMLGYNNSNPQVFANGQLGYGSGPIFLTNVNCRGDENSIEHCTHPGWSSNDCKHAEDVGIDCSTGIRLVGGKGPYEGRVEVFHNGEWGTICNNKFDNKDANVICGMLGYTKSSGTILPISQFRTGFGQVWMENLMCTGRESDIALCKFNGWGNSHCSHSLDVGITCGEDIQVRLRGGRGTYEGRLEISNGTNAWLPVCNTDFTMETAKVACRHFGYLVRDNDPSVVNGNEYETSNTHETSYKIHCTGDELDIGLCDVKMASNAICSSGNYIGIICPRTEVRLVSTSMPSAGRIEIYHGGRWGSVCGHSFDSRDAKVICRMLGFEPEGAKYFLNGTFGKSDESPWLDDLVCSGFENDIQTCRFNWTSRSCNGYNEVGVSCASTSIRLASGAGPWEGRIEVFSKGQWGTICDSSFGVPEASVICRMLGFKELYTSPRPKLSSTFGRSHLSNHLDMMSCSGTELDIHACIKGAWGADTCNNSHEAGVDCRETNVRLTGGSHSMEGRVEILINGVWSAVCDEDWDDVEATMVCKMLAAYPFDRQIRGKSFRHSFFGNGKGKIAFSRIKCNRTEIDLMHCSLREVQIPTCDHSNEAGVVCILNDKVKLSHQGNSPEEGTVLMNINGEWSTICDTGFDTAEASVICRELGYWSNDAKPFSKSWFGSGNGTSRDVRPQCTGTESKLAYCPLGKRWGQQSCTHLNDAGVQCTSTPLDITSVRLVDGDYPGMGRLEVLYNGKWGSFCWRHWNAQNAKVLCKMLRYSNSSVRSYTRSKNGSAILIGSLMCSGKEANIGNCKAYLDKEVCTDEAVGVDCTGNTRVQLTDGNTDLEGRVDIYDGNHWGSICDNAISINEAKVICSTATGYTDTQPSLYHLLAPEIHESPFIVNKVTCAGWEEHISQCSYTKSGSCGYHFAHVKCFKDCTHIYTAVSGDLKSTNYPQFYQPNIDCVYIIKPMNHTVYKIEILDLQMANSGDYLEIKNKANGRVIGHYSIFNGVTPVFSDQFYVRYKTDAHEESKGFHLQWSVADVKDVVTANCQTSKWGAAVNLTSLAVVSPSYHNAGKIFLNSEKCYGFIYDDWLLFQQSYAECSSSKSISNGYITYTNKIVYLDNGNKRWEVPLQCRKLQTTRISNYHLTGKRRSVVVNEHAESFQFSIQFYYDLEKKISEEQLSAFNNTYFYRVSLDDSDEDLTFILDNCFLSNDADSYKEVIKNGIPADNAISLKVTSRDKIIVGISVPEDVPSQFVCDATVLLK